MSNIPFMGIEELQNRVLALIPDHLYCEKEQASIHFEIFRMQAVKVIAPLIEWGEKAADSNHILSKCDQYRVSTSSIGDKWWAVFYASDCIVQILGTDDPTFAETAIEAQAICQAHKQKRVNEAINGCKLE